MIDLVTGNEAIALGAYEAGVTFASAYPGTPSTEILEHVATFKDTIIAEWANNEKVAIEAAIGASIAGARSLAAMKHVGVNVAADPLFTYAYTGVNGGFVLISADEPGHHSSQNEQDNRIYAKFAKIAMLEPASSQEAFDMVVAAYEISEDYDTPVLIRMTTRVCHSKSLVNHTGKPGNVPVKPYVKNIKKYMTVPAHVHDLRVKVEERLGRLLQYAETTPLNYIVDNQSAIGVIASGMCHHYAQEVFGDSASYLKLGFTHPLPVELIRRFASSVETLYIIEENDPYIEDHVRRMGIPCIGKELFPYTGEMTPDVLRKSLGQAPAAKIAPVADKVSPRPPVFCAGCPHRGLFYELGKMKDIVISGDIGCYTLAFAEPLNAMDFNICMGASVSCGHGAQKVFNTIEGNKKRVVTVLGDSTFFHTGINSLINTAYNGSNTINIILDNRITGMTGHQQNPGSGYTLQNDPANMVNIEALVKACGIEHVVVIDPNSLDAVKRALAWARTLEAPSVIITRWPCVLKRFSAEDKAEFPEAFTEKFMVNHDVCIGCKKCTRVGCPAIVFDKRAKKTSINQQDCVGCSVCAQVCPVEAIQKRGE